MNSQQRRFARRHNLVNRFALERAQLEIKQADATCERVIAREWAGGIRRMVYDRIVCALSFSALAFAWWSAAR